MNTSGEATVGRESPWFAGWNLDNRVVNKKILLKKNPGKGCVLVFFATWCEPCKKGLSVLEANLSRLRQANLVPVLVAYRQDAGEVRPWAARNGLKTVHIILDRFGKASLAFGAAVMKGESESASLPRTVVLDPIGRVRAIFGQEGDDYMDRILAAAIDTTARR